VQPGLRWRQTPNAMAFARLDVGNRTLVLFRPGKNRERGRWEQRVHPGSGGTISPWKCIRKTLDNDGRFNDVGPLHVLTRAGPPPVARIYLNQNLCLPPRTPGGYGPRHVAPQGLLERSRSRSPGGELEPPGRFSLFESQREAVPPSPRGPDFVSSSWRSSSRLRHPLLRHRRDPRRRE